MRKLKTLLILIIGFIAFQLLIDGVTFVCDQAEIAERCSQLREHENYRLSPQSFKMQKTGLICGLLTMACLFECKPYDFVFTAHNKCSIFVSELFNNSPPFFVINA